MDLVFNIMTIPRGLLNKEDTYFVGVSGGVDSIAACHWLKYRYRMKNVWGLHFNHNLREQNNKMETKVAEFCAEFEIPVVFKTLVCPNCDEHSLRQERIKHITSFQTNVINCHHLNDAVESYVSNTFTGHPEYVPIKWKTEFDNGSVIYHPFLRFKKQFFIDYAKENNLFHFVEEDETNTDVSIRRNHIRHVIVPEMNRWSNLETVVRKKFYAKNRI